MAIPTSVTGAKKASKVRVLDWVSCICYPVQFQKDKGRDVLALLNSGSKVNVMTPAYAAQLGLKMRKTNFGAQKIDGSSLATYGMVIAAFQVLDMLDCSWFFQKTFLLADISKKLVLGMFFLTFSNVDVQFAKKELIWRTYTTKEVLPTTRQVELIDQKKFAKPVLDKNIGAFMMEISSLRSRMTIYPAKKAQLALLLVKKVTVWTEYLDFANVFFEELANVLLERIKVNDHAINLEEGKQVPYALIYSLKPVEFKTFKTYIETKLANSLIRAS